MKVKVLPYQVINHLIVINKANNNIEIPKIVIKQILLKRKKIKRRSMEINERIQERKLRTNENIRKNGVSEEKIEIEFIYNFIYIYV